MHGSCHLDRALNFEIGVEYQIIFVVKCILGYLQDEWFHYKTSQWFTPPFNPAENKKEVNKYFDIWH